MKTLRILMLAMLLPAFVMTGCDKGGDDNGDAQIELPNNTEKTQTAFADDETTGGFTFTAKQAWTATVTETTTRANLSGGSATRADGADWLRLLFDGRETYSGAAGKFTLVIELDENYSGKTRTATITIKSGNDTITITVTQDGKTETGVVPTPPDPDPDGMRYVSRIDVDYGYSFAFEYDSKNRVIRVTGDSDSDFGNVLYTFSYDDAARTVTMMDYDDGEEVVGNRYIFELNANGAVASSEGGMSFGDAGTFTYTDGYLGKFVFTTDEWGTETFTMTWNGGNKTRMIYDDEDPDYDPYIEDLTYNASWSNNPLCNLDLNAFIAPFDDGIYGEYPIVETMGLFGKRSRNMISGTKVTSSNHNNGNTSEITVEYDTAGFVTKITAIYNGSEGDAVIYTITYR